MTKLEKVQVIPDGNGWKIEILDEAGGVFHVRYEEVYDCAVYFGQRQSALYQLPIIIIY